MAGIDLYAKRNGDGFFWTEVKGNVFSIENIVFYSNTVKNQFQGALVCFNIVK